MTTDHQQPDRDPTALELQAADLELVASLVARSCSALRPEERGGRRQELLTAVAAQFATPCWLAFHGCRGEASTSPVELTVGAEGAWSSATQRSAVLASFEALASSHQTCFLKSPATHSAQTCTLVRSELVSCPGWRKLAETIGRELLGDFVVCCRVQGAQHIKLWVGFRGADAAPFTPRELAMLSAIYAAVAWLPACGAAVLPLPDIAHLPHRVREAFHHFRTGKSTKEIAKQMGISHHTVGDYFKHIYRHFGVNSGRELLALLLASGELSTGNSEPE